MDFSKIDFDDHCVVGLIPQNHDCANSLFFSDKKDLVFFAGLLKKLHDLQPYFNNQYVKGFIKPNNIEFKKFMEKMTLELKNDPDYYEETCHFLDLWNDIDNNISKVEISFPFKEVGRA